MKCLSCYESGGSFLVCRSRMSPAIKGDSTTAHTRSSKHTPLPTPTIPLTSVLEIDPLPNLGQLWAVERLGPAISSKFELYCY